MHDIQTDTMDISQFQHTIEQTAHSAWLNIQRIPGSAIVLRYIQSSYQNDPVRSAIELFLFLFAVRYLLAPSYSVVQKSKNYADFTEAVG